MDKTFDFASVERRIAALWEQTGAFRAVIRDGGLSVGAADAFAPDIDKTP